MLDSLCNQLGVKHKLSSAYYPQTNGLVERFNRTLCETLAKFSNENKDDWDLYIPSALFAYRTMRHNTTRHEPFYLAYGREVTLPVEFQVETLTSKTQGEDDQYDLLRRIYHLIGKLKEDRNQAQRNIEKSQAYQKQRHDNKLKQVIKYKVNDLVLLYKSELKGRQKLIDPWKGPYYIHEILANGAYKLRTMDRKVLKDPVNSDRLKLYHQRTLPEPIVVIGTN